MQYKVVTKCVVGLGIIFVALSAIELVFMLLIALTEVYINGEMLLIQDLLLNQDLMPIEGIFLWIFIIMCICIFMVIGLVFIIIGIKKNLDGPVLAKYLTILGMFILVLSFIKLEYIVLLGKSELSFSMKNTLPKFQALLFNNDLTPIPTACMWIFLTAVVCSHLMAGLVVAASGINWTLEYERQKEDIDVLKPTIK